MEEICYLDAVRLVAYDLPPGWQIVLDERFAAPIQHRPGSRCSFAASSCRCAAENDRGEDVSQQLRARRLDCGCPRERVIRVSSVEPHRHSVTLTFAEPLDQGPACLVMDGWIEYPYSQTMFAAWQAGATYEAPTVEAEDQEGNWHVVLRSVRLPGRHASPGGAAAGSSKRLPAGTKRLRLTTNLEIYWDCLAIVLVEPPPDDRPFGPACCGQRASGAGFARRETHAQRRPDYDYQPPRPALGHATSAW